MPEPIPVILSGSSRSTPTTRAGANVLATWSRRAHPNETKPDATEGAVPAGVKSLRTAPFLPVKGHSSPVSDSVRTDAVCSAQKPPCSTIAPEGAVAPGNHQRAAYPRRGFTLRFRRFEDSMETCGMES